MFEARFDNGDVLRQIIDAMKELVTEANIDCSGTGLALQAMDSSHVSLCALQLKDDGFSLYRCDRNISLGLNLASFSKLLKCANKGDTITLKAEDEGDALTMTFENDKQDRFSDFEMKLMDIDSEHLGIPETEYACTISLPAGEFARIVNDLSTIGETCTIKCSKDGVQFSVAGDIGTGNMVLKPNAAPDGADTAVSITMEEEVELAFALRYLKMFTKATSLSDRVTLSMSNEVPLAVEYGIENYGYLRYYLAPKIDDDAE